MTAFATKLTVQSKSGLPIIANCKHSNTLSEQVSANSDHFQIFQFHLVIVQATHGYFVELIILFLYHVAVAFGTLFRVIFHIVAPSCDVLGLFYSVLTSVFVLINF